MKLHKQRLAYAFGGLFLLIFTFMVNFGHSRVPQPGHADNANVAYSPQPGRNAEWLAGYASDTSDPTIMAKNLSYIVVENNNRNNNFQQHFADVRKIAAAGQAIGTSPKILEYFNSSVWLTGNQTGWAPYSNTFNSDWYMKDSSGNPIQYAPAGVQYGYLIDETNPDYRAWALNTIVAWMSQAPYKGIALDSANELLGQTVRAGFTNSQLSLNDLFCGTSAPLDAKGNCGRVSSWNAGLTTLVQQVTQKLHSMGDEVIVNGIAPTPLRGPTRNLALVNQTDTSSNESFCYDSTAQSTSPTTFEDLATDANLMRTQAAVGKKIMQISNHQDSPTKTAAAPYCLAGFLMGWQPGYDFYAYHKNYNTAVSTSYPEIPEQNLNLGNPLSSGFAQTGAVLSRSFQNGFVAVNTSDTATDVSLPAKLVQFKNGSQGQTYAAGTSVALGPRSGLFFLNDSYLNPITTSTPSAPPAGNGSGAAGSGGGQSSIPASNAPPKGVSVTTSKPLDSTVSGMVEFKTSANADYLKIEYYLNDKLAHTATTFPDDWKLDTATLKNGSYVLTAKYYHRDGSVTTSKQTLNVSNNLTAAQIALRLVKRALVPTVIILALVGLGFYVVHRFKLLRPKWLYKPNVKVVTSDAPAHQTASLTIPNTQAPGMIIGPDKNDD